VFLHRKRLRSGRRWRRAFVLIVALTLVAGVAAMTNKATQRVGHASNGEAQFTGEADSLFYSENVVIDADNIQHSDVIVYSGDVRIKAGGLVKGDLVVYSGDVEIDAAGKVEGDVTTVSGDAEIDGAVGGDLVVWSGDITLQETALIAGNVSVMSGEIDREPGAVVQGNIVAGGLKMPKLPDFLGAIQAPAIPAIPAIPAMPAAPALDMTIEHAGGWGSALLGFLGRLVAAAFGASLIILLAGLVYYVRPEFVGAVQQTLQQQRPLSFAVGLVINLVLTFLTGVLVITLCLAPVGLAAGLLFAVINVVGWSVLSLTVGQWLLSYAKIESQPLVALLVGAFMLTSLLAFGWTIGGCLRPLTYLASLVVTAFGGGAVVVYWLRLGATPKADTPALSV
jgi:cytoskeletal protein CcmA (bactofilin family)